MNERMKEWEEKNYKLDRDWNKLDKKKTYEK